MVKLRRINLMNNRASLAAFEGQGDGVFSALEITDTQNNQSYVFELYGNHLRPLATPPAISGEGASVPWYESLTAQEQQLVFTEALSQYRQRSRSEMPIAALGVTTQGDIYVGVNTESLSSNFYRQCAEQSMVTIATDRDASKEYRHRLAVGDGHESIAIEKAKLPQFRSFTLMGGMEEGKAVCPCGNCTELLNKTMAPGAPIYIAPVALPQKLEKPTILPLPAMDVEAKSLAGVQPASIWKTSMERLNADRFLPLKDRDLSANAYHALCEHITEQMNFELAHDYEHFGDNPPIIKVKKATLESPGPLRTTVPDLPFPETDVNNFLSHMIARAVTTRVRGLVRRLEPRPHSVTVDEVRQLIEEKITSVRCAVLQTQSGAFYHAIDATSALDGSLACAEIMALGGATEDSPEDGIRNARVMELNPKNLKSGMLETSPKDGVERLAKRKGRNGFTLMFGYYPFNGGGLGKAELKNVTEIRKLNDIFPGFFVGVKPATPENKVETSSVEAEKGLKQGGQSPSAERV